MSAFKNILNKKFGLLTVIKLTKQKKGKYAIWLCRCECGNIKKTTNSYLQTGHTKSCGCLSKKLPNNFKHGMTKTRFYKIWACMNARCNNKKEPAYIRYGEKGIKIIWVSFKKFKKDMYESYLKHCKQYGEKQTTIDRIDNNKGYSKENCRWATYKEQSNNRKTNIKITYNNQTKTLKQWADFLKIPYSLIYQRIKRQQWRSQKALSNLFSIVES